MYRQLSILVLAAALSAPGLAASVTLAGLMDGDDGTAVDLDGSLPVTANWVIGAGIGQGDSRLEGEEFSATSLRARTDLQLGNVFAHAGAERWKDSGQLEATTLRAGLGWMAESGLAISALFADRSLDLTYTATVLGTTRQFDIGLDGTGSGGEIAWFGAGWSVGARFLDYDYGRNLDRIRAIRESADTGRFPRLQRLVASVATRAAGAPDREMALLVMRQFGRFNLAWDWQQQRDAVTRDRLDNIGVTLGVELSQRFVLDAIAGYTTGGTAGTVPWAGMALTLRSAAATP
jgi:hypothetical protein